MVVGLLTLALAALGAANAWMALHRLEGYMYRVVSYPQAYIPLERPMLEELRWDEEQARLELTLSVVRQGERDPRADEGRTMVDVEVPHGLSTHDVSVVSTVHESEAQYTTVRSPVGDLVIASTNLLIDSGDRVSLRAHTADVEDYDPAHVEKVRAILATEPGTDAPRSLERLRNVWLLLHRQLASHAGNPPPDYKRIPAFVQYERALAGDMHLFCANYAEILTLFATVAGLHARIVDAGGELDGFARSAHTFVEVYLPEYERWVYTDLTLGLFMVRIGADGPPVNSVRLAQFQQAGAQNVMYATVVEDGALRQVPFAQAPKLTSVFINPNAFFVFHQDYRDRYSPWKRVKRYLLGGAPALALNDTGERFRTRMDVQWLTLLVGGVWLVAAVAWLRARR